MRASDTVSTPTFQDLGQGITCIDTGYIRPALAACYLLVQDGKAAFIDTGTNYTVPLLLELLKLKGIANEDVAYVMPTHVHLDHGGGAGELMRHLSTAELVIHPRGARHMIDPTKLTAGATAVYGEEEFHKSFGVLAPVPESRVVIADDGFELDFNGRQLLFLNTPGHARHHYCVYDETSQGFFTGDTFGISYREFDGADGAFIIPTTPPTQFDPEAWQQSLDRLMSYKPERMYLTHFGMVTGVPRLADDLRRGIDEHAAIAREADGTPDRSERIVGALDAAFAAALSKIDNSLSAEQNHELLKLDIGLNAQGLEFWLDHQRT